MMNWWIGMASCVILLGAMGVGAEPVKRMRTLLTADEIAKLKADSTALETALHSYGPRNYQPLQWGPAEFWIEQSDDYVWRQQVPSTVRRVIRVGMPEEPDLGCPVHGQEVWKHGGHWPWILDARLPGKLKCPVGGEIYPSNDYLNGDMTTGPYADDGSGCVVDGKRYHFIGAYGFCSYGGVLISGLRSLSRAYTLTGDKRYAHKAAILLLRMAYEYPNSTDRRDRTHIPGYDKNGGMYVDWSMEWGCMRTYAMSYDEIFDTIATDTALIDFIKAKVPSIQTGAEVQEYIEDRLLRPALQAIIDGVELVNFAFTEQTAADLAIVLADSGPKHPNSIDAVEWMYHGGGRLGDIGNQFYKDGSSYESIGYNSMRSGCKDVAAQVRRLKALLPGKLSETRYPDILANEKVARFDDYQTAVGGFTLGDGGASATPATLARPSEFLDGYGMSFLRSGDAENKRSLCFAYSTPRGHAHYDVLSMLFNGMGRELLPGLPYPATWAYHSVWEQPMIHHNQVVVDRMDPCSTVIGTLETWAPGGACQLMEMSKKPYRQDQPRGEKGPKVTDYRRMSALVDLEDGSYYCVDLFRVTGGKDHLQSWHGNPTVAPALVEGAELKAQPGTLAGPNVAYGSLMAKGEQPAPAEAGSSPAKAAPTPAEIGLCFLKNIRRGPMDAGASVTWEYGPNNPAKLRLTFVPTSETELILADGGHPVDLEKDIYPWAFPHRTGPDGLVSQFLTVIEPYAQKRSVQHVRLLPVKGRARAGYAPLALEIQVDGGRDLLLYGSGEKDRMEGEGFSLTGRFGWVRERNGKVVAARLVSGTRLSFGSTVVTTPPRPAPARIVAVERGARTIVVEGTLPPPAELIGRRILIDNHGERRCSNTVTRAETVSTRRTRLILDTEGVVGEGVAAGYQDGVLLNGKTILIPMAGLVKMPDGRLDTSDCLFRGTRLENGQKGVSHRVLGVMGFPYQAWGNLDVPGTNHVHLEKKVSTAQLKKEFEASPAFKLYEYGIGDTVTFDRVKDAPEL